MLVAGGEVWPRGGAMGIEDGLHHAEGLGVFLDGVDAEDAGAALAGPSGEGSGGGFAGEGVAVLEQMAHKGFAADAEEDGAAVDLEIGEGAEEGEVVLEGFAKADARVKGEAIRVDADGEGLIVGGEEAEADFGDDVGIFRLLLHGAGGAAEVHEDEAGFGLSREGSHGGVVEEAGDIVDDVGASVEGGGGDAGLHGVDGNGNRGAGAEADDDGEDAAQFFGGG